MAGRSFLDTNILVFLFAGDDAGKRGIAESILREGLADRSLVISTQVMQEFYSVVTRKFRRTISGERAEQALRDMMELQVVVTGPDLILAAAARTRTERLPFWDSLILETALHAGCSRILTEDFQTGREYGSLRIVNPFLDGGRGSA